MAPASWLIWGLSLGALVALLLRDLWRGRWRMAESVDLEIHGKPNRTRLLVLLAVFALITLVILLTAYLKPPESMGSATSPIPWASVGLLYLFMLAGIVAQFFSSHLTKIFFAGGHLSSHFWPRQSSLYPLSNLTRAP